MPPELLATLRRIITHRLNRSSMARSGRSLEVLVATIERALADTDAVVSSPDRVVGHQSGTVREIDVSIRGRVGSTELFVIFECRDRARRQAVDWIEQIAAKRSDVGTQLAVAVSSGGFTQAAIRYARAHGIALRVVDELTPADVRRLFGTESITYSISQLLFRAVHLSVTSPVGTPAGSGSTFPSIRLSSSAEDWQRPIFGFGDRAPNTSLERIQLEIKREFDREHADAVDLLSALPEPGSSATALDTSGFTVYSLVGPAEPAYVQADDHRIPIDAIAIEYSYIVRVSTMMIESWKAYGSMESAVAQAAEGTIDLGVPQGVTFLRMEAPGAESPSFVVHVSDPLHGGEAARGGNAVNVASADPDHGDTTSA